MNQVITIRLGHYVLTIDEDAAKMIATYTEALRRKYAGEEGAEEIVSDIEERMGELLEKKQKDHHRNFNTESDVQEVIAQLGPMEGDDKGTNVKGNGHKRLFRDPDNRILGGVWGGVGAYFDIDPVILRVIWVLSVFTFGFGVPLYIILWVVVPEARTTAEKLMMRGERPTLQNIEDNIKSEMSGLSDRLNNTGTRDRFSQFVRTLFEYTGRFVLICLRFAMAVAGAFLVMLLISLLIGVTTNSIYFHNYHVVLNGQKGLNTLLSSAGDPFWIKVAAVAFILILIAWVGLFIFSNRNNRDRIRMPRRYLGWASLFAGLILFVFAFDGVRSISSKNTRLGYSETLEITGDTLYVNASGLNTDEHGMYTLNVFSDIRASEDGKFRIEQQNVTYGHNRLSSASRSNSMERAFNMQNNVLSLKQGQEISDLSKGGLGWAVYTLYVPKGKTVATGKDFHFTENNYTGLFETGKLITMDTAGFATSLNVSGQPLNNRVESIELEGKWDVQIIKSDQNRMELVSGPVLSHREWIDIEGGRIRLSVEGRWLNDQPSYVRFYLTDLSELQTSGIAQVRFTEWIGSNLVVESEGASEIEGSILVSDLSIQLEGSSRAELKGEVGHLNLEGSGAILFNGANLKSRRVTVDLNGASKATVWATDELEGEASGAASISAKGNPKNSHIETTGAASYKKI